MKKIFSHTYFKLAFTLFIYLLWCLWLHNYWLLLLSPLFYDLYVTHYWKKGLKKIVRKDAAIEWIDTIIFALVAATLIRTFLFELYVIPTSSLEKTLLIGDHLVVSKVSFGPRVPNTPIALPLVHNTLPFTSATNSYVEWVKWPYKRLAGLDTIHRNDIVVFNFPAGDTIVVGYENPDYYSWIDKNGRDNIWRNYAVKARPVDKRENYVKRCVAIAGDTLLIRDGNVFTNGQAQFPYPGIQFDYVVKTRGTGINKHVFERLHIAKDDIQMFENGDYLLPLTQEDIVELKKMDIIASITKWEANERYEGDIFPRNRTFNWTKDNFGPLYIPRKGSTIQLTPENLILYSRIIGVFENNHLEIKGDQAFINGKPATSYTFKMNYFWMMGDNRDKSADSRFWGFVPEDHVVGKPVLILFSLDKDKSFFGKLRLNRLFKIVKN